MGHWVSVLRPPSTGCGNGKQRSIKDFKRMRQIGCGADGYVFEAKDAKSGKTVAVKIPKGDRNQNSLRDEIECLSSLNHPYIIKLREVVGTGQSTDSVALVMEFADSDVGQHMEAMKRHFTEREVKKLMYMLFDGVSYLHLKGIVHRDLKPSNLLLQSKKVLNIADFGRCRKCKSLSSKLPFEKPIGTVQYSAPEVLLEQNYTTAVDMWAAGCIMAELLTKNPLFWGISASNQLQQMLRVLGTPEPGTWPDWNRRFQQAGLSVHLTETSSSKLRIKFPPASARITSQQQWTLSEHGFDLLSQLLEYNPEKRITAKAALKHKWFADVHPLTDIPEVIV